MTIDVPAERVIPLPPEQVATYAMDGRHDAEWTQDIRTAELTREAGGGFGVGVEVTRAAYFVRVQAGEGGFYRLAAPLLARQVRSSISVDLRDLEHRLTERE
ncbi:SRPBCC family protein [Streptomyces albicerus]|uniref:hypothetical protein n=1 Tax=Streptomyces albicerus TaxID=2569859 RepID=UPI00124B67F7|nr:hypothetical protein [Streptomyces albicerus]